MTKVVINKAEALSMIFTPKNTKGQIVKTQEAYKVVFVALKNGSAEKTCDTDTTLMYNIMG